MSRCEGGGLSRHRTCRAPMIAVESEVRVLSRAQAFDQVTGLGFYSEDRVKSTRGI